MRIVAGRYRGRRLRGLPGADVRPTADRVREAMFNILAHSLFPKSGGGLVGAQTLDAFAGTGALGFEALSRGAAQVIFIDNAAAACRIVEHNAAALHLSQQVRVLKRDATRPGPAPWPCRLAFLDPPYGQGLGPPALDALAAQGWLEPGALAVLELARREPFEVPQGFRSADERAWGTTRLLFLVYEARE